MQANEKKLYLGYGNHDFSAGSLDVSDIDIAPGQTETISLSAKTGIVTTDIASQKVATVVITVGIKNAAQRISFKLQNTTYNAEEGMTWLAWLDSEYNTDRYHFEPETNHVCNFADRMVVNVVATDRIEADAEYFLSSTSEPE